MTCRVTLTKDCQRTNKSEDPRPVSLEGLEDSHGDIALGHGGPQIPVLMAQVFFNGCPRLLEDGHKLWPLQESCCLHQVLKIGVNASTCRSPMGVSRHHTQHTSSHNNLHQITTKTLQQLPAHLLQISP